LPPSTARASRQIVMASRTLFSFPKEICSGDRVPASLSAGVEGDQHLLLDLQHHLDELALGQLVGGQRLVDRPTMRMVSRPEIACPSTVNMVVVSPMIQDGETAAQSASPALETPPFPSSCLLVLRERGQDRDEHRGVDDRHDLEGQQEEPDPTVEGWRGDPSPTLGKPDERPRVTGPQRVDLRWGG
jgi:hypothetical protein